MVKTDMKTYSIVIMAFVVCMSLSYAAFAGIGAESSSQPAVSNVPPYPGTDASGAFLTSAQPAQYYPDIPQYMQQGTSPMYGGTMYAPYGTMPNAGYPGSGDMSGMMYAPYGTTPNMYGDMSGGMYQMPPTGDGNQQYPMPYTMYPYDPNQGYGQQYGQYGEMPGTMQGTGAQYGQQYGQYGQMPGTTMQGPGGYGPYSYGTADQTYTQAKQAFDSQDYWTAMSKFQEVASRFPQSDLVDNAYYWTGEIYYTWKNFPAAIQSFQTVLYSYPQGNKAPDAHVKMGFAYAEMRQYGMAKSILNDVASRYQDNTRIRGLALNKLNQLNNQ